MQVHRQGRGRKNQGLGRARRGAELDRFAGIAGLAILGFLLLLPIPSTEAAFTASTANATSSFAADTLDPPTSFSASSGVTVTLDWTATPDTYATGHRILRSATSGGPYTQIAEVAPRTDVDHVDAAAEGTYYYVSRAYFGGWESVTTAETSGRVWRAFDCPSDADLRACIRFDQDVAGTYLDESGNSNMVVHNNGSLIPGISDQAIDGVPTATYEVADSVSLDLTSAMTIEAWIRMDSLPTSGRVGLMDRDGQYALLVYAGTGLRCSTTIDALPHEPVTTGVWFHAACTWDGATLTLYVNGQPVQTMASTGTIATANTNPMSLLDTSPAFDEPADGAMDNLRIWHSARTQAQICADAGISGC